MAAIDSIEDRVEARILVLDEWAANLDRPNTRRISVKLDRLSGTRAVVEILHGEVS
jgi:ABC-type bacteriocin/lantibiotic exporter with double-glycine peptidase domain